MNQTPAHTPARPGALPEPELTGAPSVLDLGDRQVSVLLTLARPRLVVFGGLLSDAECDALVALARPRLSRSETVDHHSGGSEVRSTRAGLYRASLRCWSKALIWPMANCASTVPNSTLCVITSA